MIGNLNWGQNKMDFEAIKEKKLKVLHIGNIANNAYHNSKILNDVGIESFVLCSDYYHVMGCPEWDQLDIPLDAIDHYRPNWVPLLEKNPSVKRPRWFVQGPLYSCLHYLDATISGDVKRANELWNQLSIENKTMSPAMIYKNESLKNIKIFLAQIKLSPWFLYTKGLLSYRRPMLQGYLKFKRDYRQSPPQAMILIPFIIVAAFFLQLNRYILDAFSPIFRPLVGCLRWRRKNHDVLPEQPKAYQLPYFGIENIPLEFKKGLIEEFRQYFPNRTDQLTLQDFDVFYGRDLGLMSTVLKKFDVIQAYSTDPIWPMILNLPYIAFEHGTIRDIPFANSSMSRMTALAYAKAACVYMTNADSIPQAEALSPCKRIVYGIHGRNIEDLEAMAASGTPKNVNVESENKIFVQLARQDWEIKGNNMVIEACKRLADDGLDFTLILSNWGIDVERSKRLISRYRLSNHIRWVEVMPQKEVLQLLHSVDAILDQFVCPCIGGATIEALSAKAAPVITYLDDELMARFYGRTIPLFNVQDVDGIYEALKTVITDPAKAKKVQEESYQWIKETHSPTTLVNKFAESYQLLTRRSP